MTEGREHRHNKQQPGGFRLLPSAAPNVRAGQIYYDATADKVYGYNGTAWVSLSNQFRFGRLGLGGTMTFAISSGVTYVVHTFLSSGTFTSQGVGTVDYLLVGGGGGGGRSAAGGGGAGAFRTAVDFAVAAQDYAITVGAGGAEAGAGSTPGNKGANSVFSSISAEGGGASPGGSVGAGSGGSGAGHRSTAGTATDGDFGNDGGTGSGSSPYPTGGGGGAGAVGGNYSGTASGAGGIGEDEVMGLSAADSFTLLTNAGVGVVSSGARYFAGGGGGGSHSSGATRGLGGVGGGGAGGAGTGAGGSGTDNTGGGAGGGGTGAGGTGGSGIVIIRYNPTT